MPPDSTFHTAQLHGWLDRIQAGDSAAPDELLRAVCGRLERLAHKLLRRFPSVHCWAQTDDVLQNSLLRLLRALQAVRPRSVREFFALAAQQMRRELLDLARHFNGRAGTGPLVAPPGVAEEQPEPPARGDDPAELERWCAFHEQVEALPLEEREVVGLIFYHGWSQAEVAELLQVSERTVRRYWESALVRLHRVLGSTEQEG